MQLSQAKLTVPIILLTLDLAKAFCISNPPSVENILLWVNGNKTFITIIFINLKVQKALDIITTLLRILLHLRLVTFQNWVVLEGRILLYISSHCGFCGKMIQYCSRTSHPILAQTSLTSGYSKRPSHYVVADLFFTLTDKWVQEGN